MNLDYSDSNVKNLLLNGMYGLEEEGLRVTAGGHMAHTPHPFTGEKHITMDFCENQMEVNTDAFEKPEDAVRQMSETFTKIQKKLKELPEPELVWPFSNPPYIDGGEDIPIANFKGKLAEKTEYRNYLSDVYGRYIMTFSGIHVNYSFSSDLLKAGYEAAKSKGVAPGTFQEYSDGVYLKLAETASKYGWILVSATAASPVLDSSFLDSNERGKSVFQGMASVRCSELGYWNFFTPIFDYSSLKNYTGSIKRYIDKGFLRQPSELYYPIRLKPHGENTLESLSENGINHIELRMFDLNPLAPFGLDTRDVKFAGLFLTWLACTKDDELTDADQIMTTANFKKAAHFDISEERIMTDQGKRMKISEAAVSILKEMKAFYEEVLSGSDPRREEALKILSFENDKFENPEKRYAAVIRQRFGNDYIGEGLKLAKIKQEKEIG